MEIIMIDLPQNTFSFNFECLGEITGNKYDGNFESLCVLSVGKKHELEVEKTKLKLDFKNPTDGLESISYLLAVLKVRLINAPTWWEQSRNGFDLLDENIIIALYSKVMEGEENWKKRLQEMTEKK